MPQPTETGPLSPEHLREVTRARAGARKVRRAARVANFSAWSIGVFAVLTLAWGIAAGDGWSLALGAGMAGVTAFEFRGAAMFARFEARGGRVLGFNQLAFGAMILLYALWSMIDALRKPLDPQVAEAAAQLGADNLARELTVLAYGAVAVISVLCFGGTALYYFSRGRVIARFVRQTPAWVVEVLRAGA